MCAPVALTTAQKRNEGCFENSRGREHLYLQALVAKAGQKIGLVYAYGYPHHGTTLGEGSCIGTSYLVPTYLAPDHSPSGFWMSTETVG